MTSAADFEFRGDELHPLVGRPQPHRRRPDRGEPRTARSVARGRDRAPVDRRCRHDRARRCPGRTRSRALTPIDWRIVAHLDGKRSIADVTRSLGASAFDVCATLHRLVVAGRGASRLLGSRRLLARAALTVRRAPSSGPWARFRAAGSAIVVGASVVVGATVVSATTVVVGRRRGHSRAGAVTVDALARAVAGPHDIDLLRSVEVHASALRRRPSCTPRSAPSSGSSGRRCRSTSSRTGSR